MQGLGGHGQDFEGCPRSHGKAPSDCEQSSTATGVRRMMRRTREDAGTLDRQAAQQYSWWLALGWQQWWQEEKRFDIWNVASIEK